MLYATCWVCLLLAAFTLDGVEASSTAPRPLKRIHVPRRPSVRKLARRQPGVSKRDALWSSHAPVTAPHQLLHSDTLLLRFVVDDEPISLVVRPTEDLLHQDARIHYHSYDPSTDSTITRTESLRPEDVRAYEGWVVMEHELSRWWDEEEAGLLRSMDDVLARTRGWARLVLPSGEEEGSWQGAFDLDGDLHTLVGATTYEKTRHRLDPATPAGALAKRSRPGGSTIIMRNSDMVEGDFLPPPSCAHDSLEYNTEASLNPILAEGQRQHALALAGSHFERMSYFAHRKRQSSSSDVAGGANYSSNFLSTIGNTRGCPTNKQVVYIGVAADCNYVNIYGSQSAARTQMLTTLNSVSAIYQRTFNVSIGAVELNVQDTTCPSTVNSTVPWNVGCPSNSSSGLDLNERLSVFSQWRGDKGGQDGAGLWHLFTNCASGSEIGVAWLGTLCTTSATSGSNGYTSGTGVTSVTRLEWQVMAHEIGHNFGAIHDCVSGCSLNGVCCPLTSSSCDSSSNYIMSPVSINNVTNFSECSIGNICSLMVATTNTSCLTTPGLRTTISLQECGNGIVDPGEECDAGMDGDACCTTSCTFVEGAVCDPFNSACCTSSCQLQSQGVVCRPSIDPTCDTAEVCNGTSATCPADTYALDGTSCGSNGLACANGICTSRNLQCQQQGASLNLTTACSLNASPGCAVSCNDPTNSGSCVVLQTSFVNGSPCGYAGTCQNGQCENGPFLDAAKSWYTRNLQISVPVTVIAGLLVVTLLLGCLRFYFARRRRGRTPPSAPYSRSGPVKMPGQFPIGAAGSRETLSKDMPAPPAEVLARHSAPPSYVSRAEPSMRSAEAASNITTRSRRGPGYIPSGLRPSSTPDRYVQPESGMHSARLPFPGHYEPL